MEHNNVFNLESDPPCEEITLKEVMEKTTKVITRKIFKQAAGLDSPDKFTWILTCRTINQGASLFKFVNKGVVLSAFEISKSKRVLRLNLASKIVLIHGMLNIDPNCKQMQFDIDCGWSAAPNSVSDASATRTNTVDQVIGNYFDMYHDLKLMGLTYKPLEKETYMQILWQLNGAAEEEVRESLLLQISGGEREYHFERTKSNSYPIVGAQSRFVLCGASEDGCMNNNVEIINIDNKEIKGEILEARFDRSQWEWKLVLNKDVILDGERAFAGTAYSLTRSSTITLGGTSIRLTPKGHPSKRRKLLLFHK